MKRPTKNLLIDAAEILFAEKGYRSTSMEDISSVVGIRPSAIYKHFKNKQELYEATLARMIEPFFEMLNEFEPSKNPIEFMQQLLRYHLKNPHLASFAFHATLGGGAHRQLLVERWYQPFWNRVQTKLENSDVLTVSDLNRHRSLFMSFNNLILGYITLAPINSDALGIDPFSDVAVDDELALLRHFGESLLK